MTYLDLATTVMKIESAVETQKSLTDLTMALDATSTTGADRVDQLNCERAFKLSIYLENTQKPEEKPKKSAFSL